MKRSHWKRNAKSYRAACGVDVLAVPADPKDVTCKSCRRTIAYRVLVLGVR